MEHCASRTDHLLPGKKRAALPSSTPGLLSIEGIRQLTELQAVSEHAQGV